MAKRITDDKKGGVEFGKFRRNIMGTLSFEFRLPNMRKMQDFSVYPATSGDTSILIQSGTRIGRIDMSSGSGVMSQSHASGAYGVHLQMDKLVPFQLTTDQLTALKEHLAKTAGSSVGSSFVKSDNSGADKFAKGGKAQFWIPIEDRTFNQGLPHGLKDRIDEDETLLKGNIWIKFDKTPAGSTDLPYQVKSVFNNQFEYFSYNPNVRKKVNLMAGSWFSMYISVENLTLNEIYTLLMGGDHIESLADEVKNGLLEKKIKGYGTLGFDSYGKYLDLEVSDENNSQEDDDDDEYARGGAVEHGLKVGDEIIKIDGNLVIVIPEGADKNSSVVNYEIVNITNGQRVDSFTFYGDMKMSERKKWVKSAKYADGGRVHTVNGRKVWRWYPEWTTATIEVGDVFYYGNSTNDAMGFEVVDFTEDDVTFKVIWGAWDSKKVGDVFTQSAGSVARDLRKGYYKDSKDELDEEYAKGGSVGSDKSVLQKTVVYDNGGDTLDRYTVFTPDGSVFAMSENAKGFNQYVGDDSEVEKGGHLGKRLKSVPKEIEWAVLDRMKDEPFAKGGSVSAPKGGQFMIDYCWADVYVDDYEEGEGASKGSKEFDFMVGEIFDYADLLDILESNLGLSTDPSDYSIMDNRITTSKLENGNAETPSSSEMESWKKGKTKLYSVHYTIGLKIVNVSDTTDELLSELTSISIG